VRTLRAKPGTAVYIDAGNANWVPPEDMAKRLDAAGVKDANGFALNVSNYVATDKTVAYGKKISEALGGDIGFVVDTSRNGQGEAPKEQWCNPDGRGLGKAPTPDTGDPLVHAFVWVKRPGESDGECNGGPAAGAWFGNKALELARNAQL
jgi:endoglucanase